MRRLPCTTLVTMLFATFFGHAAGLPDTGQATCYDDSVADVATASDAASISRDAGTHPRQDCRFGHDPAAAAGALTKRGAGANGFDYTKIANNGSTLAAGVALGTAPTDWACTKDNLTGLTWEVKTASSTDLRYSGHTYTWFSSNNGTNGGNAGDSGIDTCNATLPPGNQCNTEAFIAAVNAVGLCSYVDWRLPTQRELRSLVHAGVSSPSIDSSYFPNTPASYFWTGSSYGVDPDQAWFVLFDDGYTAAFFKTDDNPVRLVRGGQF
jgi:hypothetical protein